MVLQLKDLSPKFGKKLVINDINDLYQIDNRNFRSLFYQSQIMLIQGICLTPEMIVKIGRKLGTPMSREEYQEGRDNYKAVTVDGKNEYISIFSNRIGNLGTAPMCWHADNPDRGDLSFPIRGLYMVSCPIPDAGLTSFLNLELGWLCLTESLKSKWHDIKIELQKDWYKSSAPVELHSSFVTHPITHKSFPRLNSVGKNHWIRDLIDSSNNRIGTQLVQDIIDQMTNVANTVYTHKWNEGDFIIYDNHCFLHSRTDLKLKPAQERLMYRINVNHDRTVPL
jgi:alpha-ketoglutarate-dependent taurine dioxygenase